MAFNYSITYTTENEYESIAYGAYWQFLILPEDNEQQQLLDWRFTNTLNVPVQTSVNGFDFKVLRVRTTEQFHKVGFEASFHLFKKSVNPFDFVPNHGAKMDYELTDSLEFKIQNWMFLRKTAFTQLPEKHASIFIFDRKKTVFENLMELNHWVYIQLYFKTGVTDVDTKLEEIIEKRHGVCQDFTHLFLAIVRENQIPARYVSGYLHQGIGYFGDSQMHAWAEVLLPNAGWIGFDPTNDILAAENHVKVCHGVDYLDCSPLKGVVYGNGSNTTSHKVVVMHEQ